MSLQLLEQIQRVAEQANEKSLTTPFVLGLSGGVDSMVLLHSCNALKLPVIACHVNHQLKQPAQQWEDFCVQTCAKLAIPFVAKKIGYHYTKVMIANRSVGGV